MKKSMSMREAMKVMEMGPALKPCPFCGGQGRFHILSTCIRVADEVAEIGFYIKCSSCKAGMPDGDFCFKFDAKEEGLVIKEVLKDDRPRMASDWNTPTKH